MPRTFQRRGNTRRQHWRGLNSNLWRGLNSNLGLDSNHCGGLDNNLGLDINHWGGLDSNHWRGLNRVRFCDKGIAVSVKIAACVGLCCKPRLLTKIAAFTFSVGSIGKHPSTTGNGPRSRCTRINAAGAP
jgi:hypothetical protein